MVDGPIRAKAIIKRVGVVGTDEDGRDVAMGWVFDCKGMVAGIDITPSGMLLGGYTIDELREISKAHLGSKEGRDGESQQHL